MLTADQLTLRLAPPIITPDIEIDIEEELNDDEHAHAIAFCVQHRGPEWYPVSGSIVQVLCGRLIRIKGEAGSDKKKCDDCLNFKGSTQCHVCRRVVMTQE